MYIHTYVRVGFAIACAWGLLGLLEKKKGRNVPDPPRRRPRSTPPPHAFHSQVHCVGNTTLGRMCYFQNVCWNGSVNREMLVFGEFNFTSISSDTSPSQHYRKEDSPVVTVARPLSDAAADDETYWVTGASWEIAAKFVHEFGHLLFDHYFTLFALRSQFSLGSAPVMPLFDTSRRGRLDEGGLKKHGVPQALHLITNSQKWTTFEQLYKEAAGRLVCFKSLLRGNGNAGIVAFPPWKRVDYSMQPLAHFSRHIVAAAAEGTSATYAAVAAAPRRIGIALKRNRRRIVNFDAMVSAVQDAAPNYEVVIVHGNGSVAQQVMQMQNIRIFISQFGSIAFKALFMPRDAWFLLLEDTDKKYYNKGITREDLFRHTRWINVLRCDLPEGAPTSCGSCDVNVSTGKVANMVKGIVSSLPV